MILVINTADKDVYIALQREQQIVADDEWESGRSLNTEILKRIKNLYKRAKSSEKNTLGIVVKNGPGSFTGLRIGLSIANAMAYSLDIPIYGFNNVSNKELLAKSKEMIKSIRPHFELSVLPEYGSEPNITQPKK